MAIANSDLKHIQEIIKPLIGKKSWGAALGHGSFLTIEFGEIVRDKRGEWHFWAFCCVWYISKGSDFMVASEDEREKMEKNIEILDGLTLISVDIQPPAFETKLVFQEEVILHLFPVFSEEYEHWLLYTPEEYVLKIGPGSQWFHHLSSS